MLVLVRVLVVTMAEDEPLVTIDDLPAEVSLRASLSLSLRLSLSLCASLSINNQCRFWSRSFE